MSCDRCEEFRIKGARFCGYCGTPLFQAPNNGTLYEKATSFATWALILLLAIEVALLFFHVPETFDVCSGWRIGLFVIIPQPTVFAVMTGTWVRLWFVVLILAISLSLAILVRQHLASKEDVVAGIGRASPIRTITILLSLDMFLELVGLIVIIYSGNDIDSSRIESMTIPELVYELANAAVWEEIVSRVLLIGIPLTAVQLIRTRRRGAVRYLFGGTGLDMLTVSLIVFSGIVFALAHDSGWGFSKVLITVPGGVMMGYLYAKVGLHATIIMHFINDYLSLIALSSLSALSVPFMFMFWIIGAVVLFAILKERRRLFRRIPSLPEE